MTIEIKPQSASVGADNYTVGKQASTVQGGDISFANKLKAGVGMGLSTMSQVTGTLAAYLPGGAVIASAAQQLGSVGQQMSNVAQMRGATQGPGTLAGNMGPTSGATLAEARGPGATTEMMASNNPAVGGHTATFISILNDNGTSGGPAMGQLGANIGNQSKIGMPGMAQGSSPSSSGLGSMGSAMSMGSAGFGLGVAGSSSTALGAGAAVAPGTAASAVTSAGAASGGDALATGAVAQGSGSQAQLMQATQGMQEMQMSFNMQYLQLQNSMQNDNRQFTMVSNIMKTKHDTVKNTISNIH